MDILKITEISKDIYNYLKNNLEFAKTAYKELIEMSKPRGLDKSKVEGYFEIHHIIPRCLNGSNDPNNLVLLSYREHIIAHLLLHVIHIDSKELFLSFSLMIQVNLQEGVIINLDLLSSLKENRSKFMKGDYNPMKDPKVSEKVSKKKKGMESTFKGKHHSQSTKKKISESVKKLGLSGSRHPMFGKKHTAESLAKMSRSHKGMGLGRVMSKDARQKISNSKKNKVIGPDGTVYESVKDAARAIGVGRDVMSRYINHRPEKGFKKII